ncbi:MAG: DUF86 domain-containing protein [Deltaproteobacteria bacterium]|nr:DUF86 domain-containing protein [Deltaproteobacteria bacterium]
MSPLDKESIRSKLARILKNLRQLSELGKLSYKKYIQDIKNTSTAERLLHVSIEAMLDVGSHIVAEEKLGEPLEYKDVFILLVQAKILPKSHEQAFIKLAGLRNRIVHLYDEIDHRLLHKALKKELGDFELFVRSIIRYLRSMKR